jgi:hypothetical protein
MQHEERWSGRLGERKINGRSGENLTVYPGILRFFPDAVVWGSLFHRPLARENQPGWWTWVLRENGLMEQACHELLRAGGAMS